MASQRESVLPIGPQISTSPVDPQPRVQTQVRQEATPQQSLSTGMDGITSALGSFFNRGQSLVEQAGDIENRHDLTLIRRENEGLAVEGQRAAEAGESADLDAMKRYDYFTAYQKTLGNNVSQKVASDFANILANAPTDGSFDAAKAQDDMLQREYGKGTGEKQFDDSFLFGFKRQTDPLVRTHQAAVVQTTHANSFGALDEETSGLLASQQGFTEGQVTDLQSRYVTLAQGDQGKGKKLFTAALLGGIYNPGQAQSSLVALTDSGWAQQNPVEYGEFTKAAVGRVAGLSSMEAMTAYTSLGNRVTAAVADPSLTGKALLDLNAEVQDTFRRLGGSNAAESLLARIAHEVPRFFQNKAVTNAIIQAHDGNVPLEVIAANMASKPTEEVNKFFDDALVQLANRPDASGNTRAPALAATARGNFMDPLASDAAASDFARLVTDSKVLSASAGMLSTNYKSALSRGLTDGMKPDVQARALGMFKSIEQVVGKDFIGRYMDPAAEGQYRAARLYAGSNSLDYFTRLATNPAEKELFKEPNLPWAKLTGSTKKDSEVETEVDTALKNGLRTAVDRDGWCSGYSVTIPNPDMQREMQGEVARQLTRQNTTNGTANLDDAVRLTLDSYKDRVVTLPGRNKTMQVVMDPMQGKGRSIESPVSIIDGQPVYAPFKVKNAIGETEDPVKTFRSDLDAAQATLGGKFDEPKKVSLQLSDKSADGLFRMTNTETGNFIFFSPGEQIRVAKTVKPGTTGSAVLGAMSTYAVSEVSDATPASLGAPTFEDSHETVTVPTAPDEARAFLAARMPPGFHVIDGGVQGGKQAYAIAYGFRIETGRKEAAAMLQKREVDLASAREAQRQSAAMADARRERDASGRRKPGEF